MSGEHQAALDEWRREDARHKARGKLLERLAQIGSIEQAAEEAEHRLQTARSAYEETLANIEDAKTRHAKACDDAVKTANDGIVKANAEASAITNEAQATAAKIIADAKSMAQGAIDGAKAEFDGMAAKRDQTHAELTALETQIDQALAVLKSTNDAVEAAHAEHARVSGLIADLKAKL